MVVYLTFLSFSLIKWKEVNVKGVTVIIEFIT